MILLPCIMNNSNYPKYACVDKEVFYEKETFCPAVS